MGSVVTPRTRVRFRPDVASREVDGEHYVLTADSTFHTITDAVGATILHLVGEEPGIDVQRLVECVEEEFETGDKDVTQDILGFVADLVDKGILEVVR